MRLTRSITTAVLAMLTGLSPLCARAEETTSFVFSDTGITAEGSGSYTIDGTDLTISGSGTYVLAGSCSDGSVTVKKGTEGVTLVLDGLTLSSSTTAPLSCNKSTEVTIVAKAGTVSTLADAACNNDELYPDNSEAENAVIKCKDGSDVTLTGTGVLNISALGKNGIKSGSTTEEEGEASLTIENLTLNVTAAVNDGIHAEARLDILSGNVTVSAADDGIKSDYDLTFGTSESGPKVLVSKSTEGIEGASITFNNGNIEVHADEDGVNAANSDLAGYAFSLIVNGGILYVDAAAGDGLDSNGTITFNGGTVHVLAAASNDNCAIDTVSGYTVNGGTVLALGSSGMAELPSSAS
ncbi:MAG: carbohydrate-binding domain-containing protein, partial [Solobacterium sp.]|nr:carbohydrate-binding domain-containing protein [Solobacterium sp.]